MSQPMQDTTPEVYSLNFQHLITEDDTPVDNLPSEKHQRLLTEPLYSSWAGPGKDRPVLAAANVGIFAQTRNPAIVPDMFLSLDVQVADDWWRKEHRSYFLGEFGKPPDLVLEIVSNTEGGGNTAKLQKYAWMRISFYVIFDPLRQVMDDVLTIYRLRDLGYERQDTPQFPPLKLGLTLWEGTFEGKHDTWLRWTDEHGVIIPTVKERADQEHQRAEQERQRAEQERQRGDEERRRADQEHQRAEQERLRAEQEYQRAERLAALLRQAGIDPNQ
ncbi:MAG: Uma2 family endonuclease [Deltaproteobacteria bacterium]|nr:Uma2 family endonuclease [Deltaproteobacteria bacterium]